LEERDIPWKTIREMSRKYQSTVYQNLILRPGVVDPNESENAILRRVIMIQPSQINLGK
jgi:hypothetical protein